MYMINPEKYVVAEFSKCCNSLFCNILHATATVSIFYESPAISDRCNYKQQRILGESLKKIERYRIRIRQRGIERTTKAGRPSTCKRRSPPDWTELSV